MKEPCKHVYVPILFSLLEIVTKPYLICTKCNDLQVRKQDEEQ